MKRITLTIGVLSIAAAARAQVPPTPPVAPVAPKAPSVPVKPVPVARPRIWFDYDFDVEEMRQQALEASRKAVDMSRFDVEEMKQRALEASREAMAHIDMDALREQS